MRQTRKGSLIESLTNIAIGAGVSFASQLVIFPLYNVHVPITTNAGITAWFTLVSVVRSYCIRRLFEKRLY